MKYCKKCRHIFRDAEERCTFCRKSRALYPIEDTNTPIYLTTAGSIQLQLLEGALAEAGIPFDTVPKEIHTQPDLFGSAVGDSDVLVPFSAYNAAYDVCVGIGAVTPEGEEVQIDEAAAEAIAEGETDEGQTMSPAKRTTVKIISAILLILLFCGVIWGTDYITGLFKGLFN